MNTALPTRKPFDWVTTAELRALIKQNLGLNARQVTCAMRSSNQYLTVTVRDASVDLRALREFVKHFNSWTMDQSDYCEGQSVHVETTKEVDAIHAAPHLAEIKQTIPLVEMDHGRQLSNGAVLWLSRQGYYVGRDSDRLPYIGPIEARNGEDWAIQALALEMARV